MITAAGVTISEVHPEGRSRYLAMALDGLRVERSEPTPLPQARWMWTTWNGP